MVPDSTSAKSGPDAVRIGLIIGCVAAAIVAATLVPVIAGGEGGLAGSPMETLLPGERAPTGQAGEEVGLEPGDDLASGAESGLGALNPGESTGVGGDIGFDSDTFGSNDTDVHFVVESSEPAYWRTGAYDIYTGTGWEQSGEPEQYEDPLEYNGYGDKQVEYEVTLERPATGLPTVWRPQAVSGVDGLVVTDTGALQSEETLGTGTTFTGVSRTPERDVQLLRASGQSYPDDIEQRYTQLPEGTPDRVESFTTELTSEDDNPYETAVTVQDWLRTNKSYSLQASRESEHMADTFIFEMDRGYCEYFATSMVTMLRSQDIPARYVVGYSTGQQVEEGTYEVRGMNAHAWVEVYFEDVGWVRFDPTPGNERLAAQQEVLDQENVDRDVLEEEGSPGETFEPNGTAQERLDDQSQDGSPNDTGADQLDDESPTGEGPNQQEDNSTTGEGPNQQEDNSTTGEGPNQQEDNSTSDGGSQQEDNSTSDDGESQEGDESNSDEDGNQQEDEDGGDESDDQSEDGSDSSDDDTSDSDDESDSSDDESDSSDGDGETQDGSGNAVYETALNRSAVPGATVEVTVTRNGDPAADREVLFNGDAIGTTDRQGRVTGTVPYEEELRITVRERGQRFESIGVVPDRPGRVYDVASAVDGGLAAAAGIATVDDTYPVATNATVTVSGEPLPGESVVVTALVENVSVPAATVSVGGESTAQTDEDGRAVVELPDEPGNTTISVERGAVSGETIVTVPDLSMSVESTLPVALPYTGATVGVSAGGAAVVDAPVRVDGRVVARTGPDGTATVRLPLANSATLGTSAYGLSQERTVSGLFWNLGLLTVLLLAVVGILTGGLVRLGYGPRRLLELLVALPARTVHGVQWVLVTLVTRGDVLLGQFVARLRQTGAYLIALVQGNISPGELWERFRRWFGTHWEQLRGERGHGERSAPRSFEADQSEPELTVREAWERFLRRTSVRGVPHRTPGELARHAIEEDNLPPEAVRTLRDVFREVEYGSRSASDRVDRVQHALAAIESRDWQGER